MNISTIIEEALAAVSSKLPNGYPNLNNAYHMMLVKEELSKRIDPKLVSLVLEAGKDDDYRAIVPGGGQYALKKKLPKGWKMGDDVPSPMVSSTSIPNFFAVSRNWFSSISATSNPVWVLIASKIGIRG